LSDNKFVLLVESQVLNIFLGLGSFGCLGVWVVDGEP
jgi:hypothetical protein